MYEIYPQLELFEFGRSIAFVFSTSVFFFIASPPFRIDIMRSWGVSNMLFPVLHGLRDGMKQCSPRVWFCNWLSLRQVRPHQGPHHVARPWYAAPSTRCSTAIFFIMCSRSRISSRRPLFSLSGGRRAGRT